MARLHTRWGHSLLASHSPVQYETTESQKKNFNKIVVRQLVMVILSAKMVLQLPFGERNWDLWTKPISALRT